jgi:hypothetical protein
LFSIQITGTGIDDINNAFDGSLTFQPALPSGDVEIVVSHCKQNTV